MDDAIKKLFIANLPRKPYTTSNLDFGLTIRKAEAAIKNTYLQHNTPKKITWLVFDCDHPYSFDVATQKGNTPAPNIEVFNKANGHSHLFYGLEAPVSISELSRIKPIKYLAAIEYALAQKLQADEGYAGLITKNPLHSHWHTVQRRSELWSLGELAEWLDLPQRLPAKALRNGLGRNCSIFDTVRKWAYKEVLKYRLASNNAEFQKAVKAACVSVNQSFPTPLQDNEVKAIAKSIAKWVWNKYTAKLKDEDWKKYVQDTHTSEIQSLRGKRGGVKSGVVRNSKIILLKEEARELYKEKCFTQIELAELYDVSQQTLSRWVK